MGGSQSVIESPVFQPLKEQLNRYSRPLSIQSLWDLQVPKCAGEISLLEIAVLLKVDADKDGLFGVDEIVAFSEFVNTVAQEQPEHRLAETVIGRCTLNLIIELEKLNGVESMLKI
jgi:hypothetical protein